MAKKDLTNALKRIHDAGLRPSLPELRVVDDCARCHGVELDLAASDVGHQFGQLEVTALPFVEIIIDKGVNHEPTFALGALEVADLSHPGAEPDCLRVVGLRSKRCEATTAVTQNTPTHQLRGGVDGG